jgi:hypothetical protein
MMENRSIGYRIVDSIPFVGKALALVWETTETAIAQHGAVIGLLKGGVVGFVLAICMVVVGEGFYAAYGLGRIWLDYNLLNGYRSKIIEKAYRDSVDAEQKRYDLQHQEGKR